MVWRGKKVAILGWGADTQDVEPWLRRQGAKITILDEKEKPFGDLSGYDVLVRSPGVYRFRPELAAAERTGVEITSKTKIFFDICPAKIIGVTGTKGKGTTATLIYEILKMGGKKAFIGGNIGKGMFAELEQMDKDSWVVLELSSFQLIDLQKSPHIAVVLMTTTSEHMDWHKSRDEYIAAKSNILRYQTPDDYAVINRDYTSCLKIGEYGRGRKVWISGQDWKGLLKLRGEHNRENMAAAAAVAEIIGIRRPVVGKIAKEFKGLEHRLEEVATVDGVTYFDDSFSTVPETTIAAIRAFTEPMVLICGGSEKGSDFTELGKVISGAGNIKAVILIGLMAERIEEAIGNKTIKLIKGLKSMLEIAAKAGELTKPGDVVVLSPAAASLDMFKNYKDRGDQFKTEVKKFVQNRDRDSGQK